MDYEKPVNPGSEEDFVELTKAYFAVQGAKFAEQIGIVPVVELGAPATPDVVTAANSLPPTPKNK
jgi:hypothetical protein